MMDTIVYIKCKHDQRNNTSFNNNRLCAEYEKIAEKALMTPTNTEHLMELKVSIFIIHFYKALPDNSLHRL